MCFPGETVPLLAGLDPKSGRDYEFENTAVNMTRRNRLSAQMNLTKLDQ
jgi:hypothetical protein